MEVLAREDLCVRVGIIARMLLKEMMFWDVLFYFARSFRSVDGNVLYWLQHAMLFPFPVILKEKLWKRNDSF